MNAELQDELVGEIVRMRDGRVLLQLLDGSVYAMSDKCTQPPYHTHFAAWKSGSVENIDIPCPKIAMRMLQA